MRCTNTVVHYGSIIKTIENHDRSKQHLFQVSREQASRVHRFQCQHGPGACLRAAGQERHGQVDASLSHGRTAASTVGQRLCRWRRGIKKACRHAPRDVCRARRILPARRHTRCLRAHQRPVLPALQPRGARRLPCRLRAARPVAARQAVDGAEETRCT